MSWSSATLIGSVQRALRLMDVVADSSRPLPVKSLAERADLTLGTTYNLVRTLIHEGYLRGDNDGLLLGDRFPSMRADEDPAALLLARARTALDRVATELNAAAYFCRYHDGEMILVDIVDRPEYPRVALSVGIQDGAHATALGKQILAELEPEQRWDYLSRRRLDRLTPNTVSSTDLLLEQLSRSRGWTVDSEEFALGTSCLAVPVRAPRLIGALAISYPTSQAGQRDREHDTTQLTSAATDLALRLGTDHLG